MVALLAVATLACVAEGPPPHAEAAVEGTIAIEGTEGLAAPISLQGVGVRDVIPSLGAAFGVPIVADDALDAFGECARFTIYVPQGHDRGAALRLVRDELGGQGIGITEERDAMRLALGERTALPAHCQTMLRAYEARVARASGAEPDAAATAARDLRDPFHLSGGGSRSPDLKDPFAPKEGGNADLVDPWASGGENQQAGGIFGGVDQTEGGLTGVAKIDDTTWSVDPSLLDEINASTLAKSARVVPAVREGIPYGFKLYGIRRATLPSALGFQNGDTLIAIAGHDVTSPDELLIAYEALKGKSEVVVKLERRGQLRAHTYRLVRPSP